MQGTELWDLRGGVGWEMGLWDPQAGEKSLGSPGMGVEPPTLTLLQP